MPAGMAHVLGDRTGKGFTMVSITTKYIGPTNTKGSRIRATRADHSTGDVTVTVPYDHALGIDDNHRFAAETLATKLGWSGHWHQGHGAPGFCHFVLATEHDGFIVR